MTSRPRAFVISMARKPGSISTEALITATGSTRLRSFRTSDAACQPPPDGGGFAGCVSAGGGLVGVVSAGAVSAGGGGVSAGVVVVLGVAAGSSAFVAS